MIGQYLSNTNEIATVSILQNILELNKAQRWMDADVLSTVFYLDWALPPSLSDLPFQADGHSGTGIHAHEDGNMLINTWCQTQGLHLQERGQQEYCRHGWNFAWNLFRNYAVPQSAKQTNNFYRTQELLRQQSYFITRWNRGVRNKVRLSDSANL